MTGKADEEWRNTKSQRAALKAKYDGRCAYCGCELDKMQADHLLPCIRVNYEADGYTHLAAPYMVKPERNVVSNMMPACPGCNKHKGSYLLEGWREILQRSAAILRRDNSTFRAGERMGIIAVDEQPITFYFERLSHDD